jgi:hypothetical protein
MPDDSDSKPKPLDAGQSGSVEVELSGPQAAHVDKSGRVIAVPHEQGTGPLGVSRSKRITNAIQDKVSGGVTRLGSGIETIGSGVAKIGGAVPLVGGSVGKLGEGISKAGESISALPRVAQTRRGRLLLRSVIVGFVMVFAWIAAIVAYQLRENDTPDFRPIAERILVEISKGPAAIDKLYDDSSPRFQEIYRKERFVDELTDLDMTAGRFVEITAINDSIVTTGPTGRTGRVALTAKYEKGICHGWISFHDLDGWKLLGLSIDLPPDLKITQAQREERVAACKDPNNRKTCDVRDAAEKVLEQLRDGKAGAVWDAAQPVWQKQETRALFVAIQGQHRASLGAYKRILTVTEAKVIGSSSPTSPSLSATFDVLAEFERSSGVRIVFGFERDDKAAPWKLRSFKVVVPNPRPDEDPAAPPPPSMPAQPAAAPGDAGVPRGRDAATPTKH